MLDHPGILLRKITKRFYNQQDLADDLGTSRYTVNQIMNGWRTITPDMALRLEKVLGNQTDYTAKDWLLMQMEYDLELARKKFKM